MSPKLVPPATAALLALALTTPAQASDPATTLANKAGEATSHTCRSQGVAEESCNSVPVGKHASPKAVNAYADSWTHRALTLQYELANDVPFANTPWIGTHNSFNSMAYGYTPSRSDSNQQLTLADQLRIDVRSVELDVHWINGKPVVCHGTEEHAGCTIEGPLGEKLDELAAFLNKPANSDQVLLLYLEDHIGNTAGYDAATAELERAFGTTLYRSTGGSCSPKLPLTLTRAEVLAAGAQVVAVASGCGGGTATAGKTAWSQMVFDWTGTVHSETRPSGFQDFPSCGPDFDLATYESRIVRYFEDSTFVTSVAGSPDDGITPETAAAMARCGVDLLGLDQLLPNDGRLENLVWSWAKNEPAGGDCAIQRRADARWEASTCTGRRPAACRSGDGSWRVTEHAVTRKKAEGACQDEGASFAVPRTGYENELLRQATPSKTATTWLGYRLQSDGWRAADAR